MQPREYRLPTSFTVFFAVLGAFVALTGAVVVPAAASQLQQGGMSGVVIGSLLIPAGALLIAVALRSGRLTIDYWGLHQQRTFTRTRLIPWSLVRSFRAVPGGRGWWFVRAELVTGKKVLLRGPQGNRDRAERIAAELTAAHREHFAGGND
jgi:Bacterial PH domain